MRIILGQQLLFNFPPAVNEEGKRVIANIQSMDKFTGGDDVQAFILTHEQMPLIITSITIAPGFRDWMLQGEHALVGVGMHTLQEAAQFRQTNTRVYTLKSIDAEGLDAVCDGMMQYARSLKKPSLIIDLQAVNKAEYSQGSLGGLTIRQIIHIIHRIKHVGNKGPLFVLVPDTQNWESLVRQIIGAWA